MTDLAEFLLARIAEDERDALACIGERIDCYTPGATDFVERFDPPRVLAECEAKRRIVGIHYARGDTMPVCDLCDVDTGRSIDDQYPCLTLKLLAAPYADHPDYREEWRP